MLTERTPRISGNLVTAKDLVAGICQSSLTALPSIMIEQDVRGLRNRGTLVDGESIEKRMRFCYFIHDSMYYASYLAPWIMHFKEQSSPSNNTRHKLFSIALKIILLPTHDCE